MLKDSHLVYKGTWKLTVKEYMIRITENNKSRIYREMRICKHKLGSEIEMLSSIRWYWDGWSWRDFSLKRHTCRTDWLSSKSSSTLLCNRACKSRSKCLTLSLLTHLTHCLHLFPIITNKTKKWRWKQDCFFYHKTWEKQGIVF